jgi:hypothetical protein
METILENTRANGDNRRTPEPMETILENTRANGDNIGEHQS